jgi:hypothetical protein
MNTTIRLEGQRRLGFFDARLSADGIDFSVSVKETCGIASTSRQAAFAHDQCHRLRIGHPRHRV